MATNPQVVTCPSVGKESDSRKILLVLPHLLNQAALTLFTHSIILNYTWQTSGGLIWRPGTVPSFLAASSAAQRMKGQVNRAVAVEDVNRRVSIYWPLVLLSYLCLFTGPNVWQLPN